MRPNILRRLHVNLSLQETDKSIRLSVSDNGAGFSLDAAGKESLLVRVGGYAGARGAPRWKPRRAQRARKGRHHHPLACRGRGG